MDTGGAETFLMKLYRAIDRERYQFDFCVNKTENYYGDEIRRMGGEIFVVPVKSRHPLRSFLALKNLVRDHSYDYVIRVSEHSLATLDLLAAKLGGAHHLVMRSSNASSSGTVSKCLHRLFSFLPKRIPTVKFAPSALAAEYTFGVGCLARGDTFLLRNGLDVDRFTFSEDARREVRRQLGLEDAFVIGHVGRFAEQKNHPFILSVFSQIKQMDSRAKLVLVGDGPRKAEIETTARELGLQDSVLFLGIRSDVDRLLNGFDAFLFPSLYEGMPNTVIEAQTNGLYCLISDTITEQARVLPRVASLPLTASAQLWAETLLAGAKTDCDRSQCAAWMKDRGYDIQDCAAEFVQKIFEGEIDGNLSV